MKKTALFLFIFTVFYIYPSYAQEVNVVAKNESIKVSETTTLYINVEGANNVSGYRLDFVVDNGESIELNEGSFFSESGFDTFWKSNDLKNINSAYRIASTIKKRGNEGKSGKGKIAKVKVSPKKTG